MSSRANKISKSLPQTSAPSGKTAQFRIDVDLYIGEEVLSRSSLVNVAGIPEEQTPEQYGELAKHTAEMQFYSVLNQRMYMEFYDRGKTARDGDPTFFNLTKIECIQVVKVEEIF